MGRTLTQYLYEALGRVDAKVVAGRDGRGDISVEAINQRQLSEGSALCHNRVGIVEQQGQWCHFLSRHLTKHPCRSDAPLGGIQHKNAANIILAIQFVGRP